VRRLIVADAHLGQRRGDAAVMVALLERAAAAGVGEVVYLGDGFQYLIGMSKFWTGAVREILAVWDRLRASGIRVVVVEGNRDFFLDEPELARRLDWAGRCYDLSAGGRRYRLVHGDRVNRRDLQYRFWASVSKSTVARLWARLLPRRTAVAIVRSMEARLATTNRRYRYVKPVADLRRAAEAAWADGVDVMLWGHFHSLWEHRQGERLAMVVPGWLETRTALLVEADGGWSWVGPSLTGSDAALRIGDELDARVESEPGRGEQPP
jgi:UDP-2,3-diacylglucosamine pyrophosphatase LpxH